ncbi:MAG: SAV_2336 N-terminal domain-related protein [Pirellulaceae bacterium]|nr:SAV_2336 N-terminal domain-related protein [Pirellulaceae bacterium]
MRVDAIDIADAAWLSASLPSAERPTTPESNLVPPQIDQPIATPSLSVPEAQKDDRQETIRPKVRQNQGNVVAQSQQTSSRLRGSISSLPHVPCLPHSLQYERSLRSMSHRVVSKTCFEIDEQATAESSADASHLNIVTKPIRERWLDAVLVIECSPSMRLWQESLEEFKKLLWRVSAIRRLDILYLDAFRTKSALFHDRGLRRAFKDNRLAQSGQRQLVLFATDCSSNSWIHGSVSEQLEQWGSRNQVVVLQVLESSIWRRTGLRSATFVAGKLARPLAGLKLGPNADQDRNYFPIVSFTHRSLVRLGPFLLAKPSGELACFTPPNSAPDVVPPQIAPSVFVPTHELGEKAFERFMRFATPESVKLARSLANAPLFLPVMRLLQHCLDRGTTTSHLAEIFASGIVFRREQSLQVPVNIDPNLVEYEFLPGVRDKLRNQTGFRRARDAMELISAYVQQHYGAKRRFSAILEDPTSVQEWEIGDIPENQRRFAQVTSEVLNRLGGEYATAGKTLASIAEGTYDATASDKLDLTDRATVEVVRRQPYPNAEIDVEDGTNIPKGTKFVLQPQSWPSDLYIPSQAKETENWTRSLIEVKREFQRLRESEPAVSCRLIQMRIPEYPGRDTSDDWFRNREPFGFSMGSGLSKDFCQLGVNRSEPLFGVFAMSDVSGKPIQNTANEPFAFRYGFSRSKFLFQDRSPSNFSAFPSDSRFRSSKIMDVCKVAADVLYLFPVSIANHVWKYWPEGFSSRANSDGYLWIDALFEVGWKMARSSEFNIKRFAQNEASGIKIELKGRGHFPRLPKNCTFEEAKAISHENGFPVQIYSEIGNIASHSIAFVNDLLVRAAKSELKYADAWEQNGNTDMLSRYLDRSIELFEAADHEVELAIALKYQATVFQRLNRSGEAEKSLYRALEIELSRNLIKEAVETYSQLASVLEGRNDRETALRNLESGKQLALSHELHFKYNELNLMVATMRRESGDAEAALATVSTVLEYVRAARELSLIFPATIEAVACLSELGRNRDASSELENLFRTTVRFGSELYFATAKLFHGKILLGLRNHEAALPTLLVAADLFMQLDEMPHCADAWFALAKTYLPLEYIDLAKAYSAKAGLAFQRLEDERQFEVSKWIGDNLEEKMNREFDVFICHASSDKERIVLPIVEACTRIGVRCWFDAHEIQWGEDIAARVADGLQKSRFVLVVVSENSRGKGWPIKEIGIAIDSEINAGNVKVLPLYVGDRTSLTREVPILANKLAIDWNNNPDEIAAAIQQRLGGSTTTESTPTETSTAYIPKIGGKITDRDRDRFVRDAFRVVADYFAEAGRHLEKQQPRIVVEVQKPDAEKLRCTAYLDGNRKAQCQIWIDSTFGSRAINFFNGNSFSGEFGAFNESIRVVETDNGLLLNGTMGGHFGDGIENANATEGAATLWKSFIRRVES